MLAGLLRLRGVIHLSGAAPSAERASYRLLLAAMLLVACEPGGVELTDPGTANVPSVVRQALTVVVEVDSLDGELAQMLGWSSGVPGADVRLLRNGTEDWVSSRTDSGGRATFEAVSADLYRLYASRTLSDHESVVVGGLRGFGDGRSIAISGDTVVRLALLADRPGTLVISEIGDGTPVP